MSELALDLRHAARALARTPGWSAGVVAVLALGLGAFALVFTVIDKVALAPLPYPEPGRLVYVWPERDWFSKQELEVLRRETASLELAAYWEWDAATLDGGEGGEPELVRAAVVTPGLFRVLGVAPALGAGFAGGEDRPGAPPAVVLSHRLFARRFAADPALVGSTIRLDGHDATVAGVMPEGFAFPRADVELWRPAVLDPGDAVDWSSNYLHLVARLARGASLAAADAEARQAGGRLYRELGLPGELPPEARLVSLQEALVGDLRPTLFAVLATAGGLLLVVAVDVAHLLLARGLGRRRELAVRSALGAGTGRLVRLLLAEGTLLALGGAGLGIGLAWLALPELVSRLPDFVPRTQEIALDGRAAAIALGVALVTGLVFAAAPALRLLGRRLFDALRVAGVGGRRERLAGGLVVAEVALATVLVAGSGLAARAFWRLVHVDPGFEPEGVTALVTAPSASRYADVAARHAFFDRLLAEVAAIPGVDAVGGNHMLPIAMAGYNGRFELEGAPPADEKPIVNWRVVTPGYFRTLGIPLLAGRDLGPQDGEDGEPVAVVNQTLVRRELGGGEAVGRRVRIDLEGDGWVTVVGVVGDVRQHGLGSAVRPEMYRPQAQVSRPVGLTVFARSARSAADLAPDLRAAVRRVDPQVPIARLQSMAEVIRESVAGPRLTLELVSAFALLAFGLGAVGLAGLVAYEVRRRVPEIGLRLALGASPRRVVGLFVRRGLALVALGVGLGLPLALGAGRLAAGLVEGAAGGDPAVYAAVAALLLAAGAVAAWIPAQRAARVAPLDALRQE